MTAEGAPDGEVATEKRPPGLLRRMLAGALLVAELILVPTVLAALVAGPRGAFGAAIGSLAAFLIASTAGWRGALRLLPVTVAVAAVAAWTAHTEWWVVLLALLGALSGVAAHIGWGAPLAFTGVIASIAQPVATLLDLLILIGFAAAGFCYGILVSRQVGLPPRQEGNKLPLPVALVVGIILAVVAAVAAIIALIWGVDHAYWLPMTVFILAVPAAGTALHSRAFHRVLGTLLGVSAAALLLAAGLPPSANIALGSVALMLAMALPLPRWRGAAFASAAIVLLMDNSRASPEIAWERFSATLLGAVLLLVTVGAVLLLSHLWRRNPATKSVARGFEMAEVAD